MSQTRLWTRMQPPTIFFKLIKKKKQRKKAPSLARLSLPASISTSFSIFTSFLLFRNSIMERQIDPFWPSVPAGFIGGRQPRRSCHSVFHDLIFSPSCLHPDDHVSTPLYTAGGWKKKKRTTEINHDGNNSWMQPSTKAPKSFTRVLRHGSFNQTIRLFPLILRSLAVLRAVIFSFAACGCCNEAASKINTFADLDRLQRAADTCARTAKGKKQDA